MIRELVWLAIQILRDPLGIISLVPTPKQGEVPECPTIDEEPDEDAPSRCWSEYE